MVKQGKCETCKYLHKLKHLVDKQWVLGSVCTIYPETENGGYDDFAIVIDNPEIDYCEMHKWRADDR